MFPGLRYEVASFVAGPMAWYATQMTRILLPTDFTERSLEAAVTTIVLFGSEDTRYTLVHAYFTAGLDDPLIPSMTAEMHQTAMEGMVEFEKRIRSHFAPLKVDLQGAVGFGPLSTAIAREAEEAHVDLVVMHSGDHARSLFGSNTADVMRGGRVPVLELPHTASSFTIRRVLFADDHRGIEEAALSMLVLIAKRTKAEVIIAHVATGQPASEQVDSSALFKRTFDGIPYQTMLVEDDNVEQALLELAKRERIDLIAALHRHDGLFSELFRRSTTRRLALASAIPVLALEQ